MKVEFKHNCEIQGKKFGFSKHMSPGIHEVPASFVFDWFFVALVLEKHAKILEVHASEFESEEFEGIDEKLSQEMKELLHSALVEAVEEETESEEESDEDDSSSDSDSLSDSEGSDEVSPEESEKQVSKKMKKKGKR